MKDFLFKKKNWRMRILSALIFSKSFGGKIKHGQTNVKKEKILTTKHDRSYSQILFR